MRLRFPAGVALAAVLIVAACSVTPKDGPQAAYETTSAFAVALKAGNAYAAMPRCSTVQKDPCSRQAVVNQIAAAANKASVAVMGAQRVAADTKADATDWQKAVAAANDAVAALAQIIPPPATN